MKELSQQLQKLLSSELAAQGFDIEFVQVPAKTDRMIQIQTLEDALTAFDSGEEENALGYFIQLKPRKRKPEVLKAELREQTEIQTKKMSGIDQAYLNSGKLNLPYLFENAAILFNSGEYTLAKKIYAVIAKSGERTGTALYWLGRCLEAEGKIEEALGRYEESIAYQPSLDSYQRLANLLMKLARHETAAEVLERALNLRKLTPATQFELQKACGNCWSRAKQPGKAEEHYKRAQEIDPKADDISSNLGALWLENGDLERARRYFEDALGANPSNHKALTGLATCAFQVGDARKAHDLFAEALEVELNNPTAIFHLVKCAYQLKSYATAARQLADYVEIAPVNANLLYSLAGLQYHLDRLDEARKTCQKIIQIQKDHRGANELFRLIQNKTAV